MIEDSAIPAKPAPKPFSAKEMEHFRNICKEQWPGADSLQLQLQRFVTTIDGLESRNAALLEACKAVLDPVERAGTRTMVRQAVAKAEGKAVPNET